MAKKSKGYKMKGSEFFGHGNSSPAKVSDSDILKLQSKLNKQELAFKEPGWAKVAGELHDPLGIMGGKKGKKGGGGGGATSDIASTASSVSDTASSIGKIGEMFGNLSG